VAFGIGHFVSGDTLKRLSGSRFHRISQRLANKGVLAVVALRLLPVAPFTIVNLVAGASHVQFGPFILGSLLGLTPGVLALSVFAGSLHSALLNPSLKSFVILGAVVLVSIAGTVAVRRWLKSH
jgi:uncharacterized membrane protein YdjX (TVP38/TMEM64 family)